MYQTLELKAYWMLQQKLYIATHVTCAFQPRQVVADMGAAAHVSGHGPCCTCSFHAVQYTTARLTDGIHCATGAADNQADRVSRFLPFSDGK